MAEWTRPNGVSKKQINRSARSLADSVWEQDVQEHLAVVNNWRTSHGFPLNSFQVALRRHAKPVADRGAFLVAQRIKRLRSITAKLKRQPNMDLTTMQDIGGCRAVMPTLDKAHELYVKFRDLSDKGKLDCGDSKEKDNYIWYPKPDGYRSIHLVGKYRTDSPEHICWDGLKIEIQIRTHLQHVWATAVETVSTFTGQPLKSGGGSVEWRRFFALMSSAIATRERAPTVPGTPDNQGELIKELRGLAKQLDVTTKLAGWTVATQLIETKSDVHYVMFLLQLDPVKRTITVRGYQNRKEADLGYMQAEQAMKQHSQLDIVLVGAQSVKELRKAFPNYTANTTQFNDLLTKLID